MNSHYILSLQSHTLSSWVSYEVGARSLTMLLCTEWGNVTAILESSIGEVQMGGDSGIMFAM